jgi:hypothetical protein
MYYFENHSYLGPMPLTRKGRDWFEPRENTPSGFYEMFEEFEKLSNDDQKKCIL